MCGVGIIALAGIVVNNNIIFIDAYNHHLAKGGMLWMHLCAPVRSVCGRFY